MSDGLHISAKGLPAPKPWADRARGYLNDVLFIFKVWSLGHFEANVMPKGSFKRSAQKPHSAYSRVKPAQVVFMVESLYLGQRLVASDMFALKQM